MKHDEVFLRQILDAADKIKRFTDDMNRDQFLADQKTQSAVIMQLALIGELAKKISAETQSLISLPWKDIAGFRDRAIYDYYQIDLEIVWQTVMDDVAMLEKSVSDFLSV